MFSDDIKPCPFCGSKDVELRDDWDEDGVRNMTILCNNCRAMLRPMEIPCNDDGECYEEGDEEYDEFFDETVRIWNARKGAHLQADNILILAKNLLSQCSKLGNLNLPKDFIKDMDRLSEMIVSLEDQIRREKTPIDRRNTVTVSRTDTAPDPGAPDYTAHWAHDVSLFSNTSGSIAVMVNPTLREGSILTARDLNPCSVDSAISGVRSMTREEITQMVDAAIERERNNSRIPANSHVGTDVAPMPPPAPPSDTAPADPLEDVDF